MLDLGLLGFTQPWLLLAGLALPALWLLLRVTPPAPRRIAFPPFLFLLGLVSREQTPARTPWWLLLLRLAIAALLILALAGPVLNPAPRLGGSGPLLLVLDDGWGAAKRWNQRLAVARDLLQQAERENRPVLLLRTAPTTDGVRLEWRTARAALEELPGWQPRPWPVDREAARGALADAGVKTATVVWLADGLAETPAARAEAERLGEALRRLGVVRVRADAPADLPATLRLGEPGATRLDVELAAVPAESPRSFEVLAMGPNGESLARQPVALPPGEGKAAASLDLPADLRNRIARLELAPSQGVGGTFLLDERWRRRTVGLVGPAGRTEDQPLLAEFYFIDKALRPFAEIREGAITDLLGQPLSLLVMADSGRLDPQEREKLEGWIAGGGVLLRFAGPKLAASGDDLVPVPLRAGDRMLGGALSWSEPLGLAPFPAASPFAGLPVPAEVRVSRQVLAEPGPELARATLASLADGTPLVTGTRRGKGWLILIHTTANTSWTSLPLSGLFVQMLERVLALGQGAGGALRSPLEPNEVLDAFGRLGDPRGTLPAIPPDAFASTLPGPLHPPGLYAPLGRKEAATELARSALNVQRAIPALLPLTAGATGTVVEPYARAAERELGPWLVLAALLLALVDLVVALALRGLLPSRVLGRAAGTAAVLLLLALPAAAQESGPGGSTGDDSRIVDLIREMRLAYVLTGKADIDQESEAGLKGLTRVLAQRTSVEAADPWPVDVAKDDLALFPLLYWPIPPDHADLSPETIERIESYLAQGGMILFDTRDGASLLPGQEGGGPGEQRLAQILRDIDLPPLIPVPADHVLTRSFYLLQDFPGRWTGQQVWVDQAAPGINDGVSSVIIGANEWAGAWAEDDNGEPLYPVVPGGETQREMARRFGVNLVMYALTGNYKTDQVHVPALLERLGQ
ncbi:DUF4159 domain-containing protein [Benzoatithermus flavus]|uniref:DUF4159 domain-containing protein n=1 Tax=Benzoatithermus flavus TaxID=3108223 RepID=A0ABU8XQQ6_9PROT